MAPRPSKTLKSSSAYVKHLANEDLAASRSTHVIVPGDVVLTNREAAAYLKTTVEQMCRLRRSGRGPAFAQVGYLIRYRKSVLDAWLESQTMTPAD